MSKKITIAIDGYSSCGKSTMAKALAKELGYVFIDTGAMYRGISLFCIENNLVQNNEINKEELIIRLPEIHLSFEMNENTLKPELILNNVNVESKIRSLKVSSLVSKVAVIKQVRQKLVHTQRQLGQNGGVVMDGRDIGSVVFPNAELKLFITSDPLIRAQRRFEELKGTENESSIEEISQNLQERDFIDTTRKESPLIQCEDAVVIDNSNLTEQQQLELVLDIIKEIKAIEVIN
jgi:cytidylate kinase